MACLDFDKVFLSKVPNLDELQVVWFFMVCLVERKTARKEKVREKNREKMKTWLFGKRKKEKKKKNAGSKNKICVRPIIFFLYPKNREKNTFDVKLFIYS